MKTIKNTAGKTICRVDLRAKQIEIVFKGCRSRIWSTMSADSTKPTIDPVKLSV